VPAAPVAERATSSGSPPGLNVSPSVRTASSGRNMQSERMEERFPAKNLTRSVCRHPQYALRSFAPEGFLALAPPDLRSAR
jgi:hypothetical protein